MSEKKWLIFENRTNHLSKQRPGKATAYAAYAGVCLIFLLSPILQTLAMTGLKLSAIFSAAVCVLPSRVRVIPRHLNSVTSSRGVPSFVKVGIAEPEKDHNFCFVSVQLEPFETCIVIEFVQLEMQIFSCA
jgi:hypothetical protein